MQRRRLLALIVGTEAFLTSFFLLAVFNKIEAPETAPQPSNERHLNSESGACLFVCEYVITPKLQRV